MQVYNETQIVSLHLKVFKNNCSPYQRHLFSAQRRNVTWTCWSLFRNLILYLDPLTIWDLLKLEEFDIRFLHIIPGLYCKTPQLKRLHLKQHFWSCSKDNSRIRTESCRDYNRERLHNHNFNVQQPNVNFT